MPTHNTYQYLFVCHISLSLLQDRVTGIGEAPLDPEFGIFFQGGEKFGFCDDQFYLRRPATQTGQEFNAINVSGFILYDFWLPIL